VAGQPLRVGVIGLGPGSILAWSRPGDAFRFFELNPQVVDFAQRYFTYLKRTPAAVEIVTGDARLSLERELSSGRRNSYDLFTVDAFSSGSIPLHLLTRESFALYREALAPNGVIAFHISNVFLDLRPIIRGLARETSMTVVEVQSNEDASRAAGWSIWALVSADPEFIARALSRAPAPPPDDGRSLVWTDDFSSLSSVIR
jgi:spermidine synthase